MPFLDSITSKFPLVITVFPHFFIGQKMKKGALYTQKGFFIILFLPTAHTPHSRVKASNFFLFPGVADQCYSHWFSFQIFIMCVRNLLWPPISAIFFRSDRFSRIAFVQPFNEVVVGFKANQGILEAAPPTWEPGSGPPICRFTRLYSFLYEGCSFVFVVGRWTAFKNTQSVYANFFLPMLHLHLSGEMQHGEEIQNFESHVQELPYAQLAGTWVEPLAVLALITRGSGQYLGICHKSSSWEYQQREWAGKCNMSVPLSCRSLVAIKPHLIWSDGNFSESTYQALLSLYSL